MDPTPAENMPDATQDRSLPTAIFKYCGYGRDQPAKRLAGWLLPKLVEKRPKVKR